MVHCERCGGNWEPKVKEPVRCRWCGSQYWRLPKRGVEAIVVRGEQEVVELPQPVAVGAEVMVVNETDHTVVVRGGKVESERDKRKREEAEVKRKLAEMKEGRPFGPIEG